MSGSSTVSLFAACQQLKVPFSQMLTAAIQGSLATGGSPHYEVTPEAIKAYIAAHPIITSITRAAFLARFTPAEQVLAASKPQALAWWLNLMDMPTIDLAAATVRADVAALASLAVITTARVAAILTP